MISKKDGEINKNDNNEKSKIDIYDNYIQGRNCEVQISQTPINLGINCSQKLDRDDTLRLTEIADSFKMPINKYTKQIGNILDNEFGKCMDSVLKNTMSEMANEFMKKRQLQVIYNMMGGLSKLINSNVENIRKKDTSTMERIEKEIQTIVNSGDFNKFVFHTIMNGCVQVSNSLRERDKGIYGNSRRKGTEYMKSNIEARLIQTLARRLLKEI